MPSSKRKLKRIALQTSEGLITSVADLVLFQFLFFGASLGKSASPPDIWRAYNEASDAWAEVDYEVFKRALQRLRRKGFIETVKEETYFKPQLTKQGLKKLQEFIPTYNKKRPWDKRIYLVTYDVAEKRRDERDLLRETLKGLGCAHLQDSVWLTPYNPKGILETFVEEHGLEGSLIVSDTGTDGAVGNRSLKELIREVYNLDELNERYKDFLYEFSKTQKDASVDTIAAHYLSILKDDPQLPFELLPLDWRGDEAFEFYEEKCLLNRPRSWVNKKEICLK